MTRYVRTGDAARALGVSPDTVRRLIERGQLRARRWPDGWYLVDADDVRRLQRLLRSGAPPDQHGNLDA